MAALEQKLQWALATDGRAEAIATDGRRFAEGMFGDACVGEVLRAVLGEYARAPVMRGAPRWECPADRGCRSLPWAEGDSEAACEASETAGARRRVRRSLQG